MGKYRSFLDVTLALGRCPRLYSKTTGAAGIELKRVLGQGTRRYEVWASRGKPFGTPLDQPQWEPAELLFTGTRAQVLAWAETYCAAESPVF